jgi:hypothetical protein
MGLSLARHAAVISGLASALLLAVLASLLLAGLEQHRRSEAREMAQAFALRLVERFGESLGAVYMLANTVDRQSGSVRQFEERAGELLRDFPLVRALELAPGGVITYVHPLRGNELAVGHDLLVDKARSREVHQAISRRQMAVAGPLELRQGGLAVVARYPLFLAPVAGREQFWGLAIGVVDFPALLRTAGDADFERLGYRYQICWVPAGEADCRTVLGDPELALTEAEALKVGSSHADWRLAVQRRAGWLAPGELAIAALLVLLGGILGGWLIGRLVADKWCQANDGDPLAASLD